MKWELFWRYHARNTGKALGYGTGIAITIWIYWLTGIIPIGWMFK